MKHDPALLPPVWRSRHRTAAEPGAPLFARLRRNLTLWYSGVLGGMLLLFGLVLYLSVHQMLLGPVNADLMNSAHQFKQFWKQAPDQGCLRTQGQGPSSFTVSGVQVSILSYDPPPPVFTSGGEPLLVACFSPDGTLQQALLRSDVPVSLTDPFIANSLVSQAIQNGSASDTLNEGYPFGDIARYAEVVQNPSGGILGVVQVGESIAVQEATLRLLLILLLVLGATTLLAAAVGGLFLAEHALAPTRLSFTRQQAFIADAAHELRTPLTLLRADAEVLLSGHSRLQPDDSALLEDIVTEAEHMGTLANNLLTLARLDAGQFHLERDVIDLADLAAGVVHRVGAFAQEKQVTVQLERATPALVVGDRGLLEQATLILVDNAIKYNRSGGTVTARVSLLQEKARLEVCDTGVGIAAEHLPHLGERFYRVDKARSREAGGAGLGISIARSIALAHQGTLTLSSIAGQGTAATLTLPAVVPAIPSRMEPAER